MSKQHECEWYMCANPAGEIYAMCRDIRCHGKVLKRDEIEARLNEHETLKGEVEALKPAWVCEFCFACLLDGDLPSDWDLVWLSAICPSCQKKVSDDGGYSEVKGGAYSNGRRDPRAILPHIPRE